MTEQNKNQSMIETNQKEMEQKIQYSLGRNSKINSIGVIPLMKPQFVGCDYENKTLTISFHVEKWQLNPEMTMHGGLITTAFDTVFGLMAHYYAKNNYVTTVTIGLTFLKPVLLHDTLTVTVKVTSKGRTLISLTAEGYVRDNVLAATSTTTFMILDKEF